MSHKQVIVLRKDLGMRKGKMVAQGAHASMAAILNLAKKVTGLPKGSTYAKHLVIELDERIAGWLEGRFKKVCVYVNSEQELLAIHEEAKSKGLITSLIQDAGLTEFGGVPTYTAVAVGPDFEAKIDEVTGELGKLGKLPLL